MSTKPVHEQMDRDFIERTVQRLKASMGESWTPEFETSLRNELSENFKSTARANSEMNALAGNFKEEVKTQIEAFKQEFAAGQQTPPNEPDKGKKGSGQPQGAGLSPVDIAALVKDVLGQELKPFHQRFESLETSMSKEKQNQFLQQRVKSHFGIFGNHAESAFRQALAAAGGEVVYRDGKDPAVVPMGAGEMGTYLKVGDEIIQSLPELATWFSKHPSGQALLPSNVPTGGSGSQPSNTGGPEGSTGKLIPAEQTIKELMRGKSIGSPNPLIAAMEAEK